VLEEELGVDVDFSAIPGLNGYSGDVFPTTSLEVRAQSPETDGLFGLNDVFGLDLGHTEFLGGVFWQQRAIEDSYFRFALNDVPFLELTAAASVPPGTSVPDILGTLLNFGGTILNPLELLLKQEIFNQKFDQEGEVIALFQQTQWSFHPEWVLQLGVRVSKETKTGYWNLDFESAEPNALLPLIGLEEFKAERSLSETEVQPKVSLNWKPTDHISLFAHWTRGFKSGGFNAFAYREDDEELKFKSETTTEWGVDMKATFFGGTLRPNISLYRMDARDFQVLGRQKPPVITGTGGIPPTCAADTACIPPQVLGLGTTRVFNAPEAYAQGMEADVNWLAFDGFSLLATLGYNDTKFVKFPQNECPASNPATYCDASGRPFPFAPRWDATLTPSYMFRLPWSLTLTPTLTAQYISSQILDTDVEEAKRQDGFLRYHATLSLANLEQGWSFQVIGKNLTDERTALRYGDVVKNNFLSVPESPREIFAQLRWVF
jgi:outer membrane receptor protein involved in Fe transport